MQHSGKRSLEGYKIFPLVAWTLIGLFALFVYHLTNEVHEATKQLQDVQFQKFDIAHMESDAKN